MQGLLKGLNNSHVVVSGGTGFLGSILCTALQESGARVTVLTRNPASPKASMLARGGVRVIPCDLSLVPDLSVWREFQPAALVCHFAADLSLGGPSVAAVNVHGTRHLLAIAEALQAPYVVFASSIEAQGPGFLQEIPLAEDGPCRPVSEYGRSKVDAEEIVLSWGRQSNRAALILRIGNVFGPGKSWPVLPLLSALGQVDRFRRVWPLLRHRLFQPLYLQDFLTGLCRAIQHRLTGVFNLTGSTPTTIDGFIDRLLRLIGVDNLPHLNPETQCNDAREAQDAAIDFPDLAYFFLGDGLRIHRGHSDAKLRGAIGNYATWSLERGLAATLQWLTVNGHVASVVRAWRAPRTRLVPA